MYGCLALTAASVAAQPARSTIEPPCADSMSIPYRERVAINLIYSGENRREMWRAIWWAGSSRTRCVVATSSLPVADTSVYGVLQINEIDDGGYEIATSLGGPRAPRSLCRSPRAAIVVGHAPVLWGVILAQTIPAFVDCVAQARPKAGTSP